MGMSTVIAVARDGGDRALARAARVPAVIQVCGAPLRTSLSMPSRLIQAAVTGRPTSTRSPTLKAAGLSTVKVREPAGT